MFPYLRTANEFIGDCESECEYTHFRGKNKKKNKKDIFQEESMPCKECELKPQLVDWLIERVNSANGNGKEVEAKEIAAWCQSTCRYMREVISRVDEDVRENICIGLEYYLENSYEYPRTRVDMIIGGYGKDSDGNDCMKLMIIELKGNREDSFNEDTIVQEKSNVEKAALEQLEKYCRSIDISINNKEEKEIKIIPCLFFHNMKGNNKDVADDENDYTYKFFYEGSEEQFKELIENTFNAKGKGPKDVFKKVRQRYKTLNKDDFKRILNIPDADNPGNSESINVLTEYENVLRPKQKEIYEELKKHVDEIDGANKKTIDIIHGGPGSGKTVLAYMLKRYSDDELLNEENERKNAIYYSRVAQYRWLGLDDTASKKEYDIYYIDAVNKKKKCKVAIFDEAHCFNESKDTFKTMIDNSAYVVLLYDEKQKIQNNEKGAEIIKELLSEYKNGESSGYNINLYHLWSQFRCGRDEGYVSWVEKVLGINGDSKMRAFICGQETPEDEIRLKDLDYEVECCTYGSENDPDSLPELKKILVDLEEKANRNGMNQEVVVRDSSDFNNKVKKSDVDGEYNNTQFKRSSALQIQGVEADEVVVIINEPIRDDPEEVENTEIKNAYRLLLTRGLKKCHILFGPKSDDKVRKTIENEVREKCQKTANR